MHGDGHVVSGVQITHAQESIFSLQSRALTVFPKDILFHSLMSHRNRLFQPSNSLRDVIWLCFEFFAPFAIVEFLLLVLYS